MSTIWIQQFTGGLDTRRLPETTVGGVLIRSKDGHINRGGEFEKRAAFVKAYDLPAGSVGLAADPAGLVVFGSPGGPPMPNGVRYQQLVGSSTSGLLVRVPSYDLYAGKLYVIGEFASGERIHFFDGAQVTDWYDGRARGQFVVQSGSAGGQLNKITINGVSIFDGSVNWNTTPEQTAADVAAAINTKTSNPDYTATAVGNQVNLIAATAGAASNGYPVALTLSGDFHTNTLTGTLAGGTDGMQLRTPGDFVRTISSKMYSTSGPNLHFSGINQPTKWTTDTTGAGFIDFSVQASGLERLRSLIEYQSFVALFAERAVVVEYVDPDPSLNKKAQVLRNTGTASPRSVTQFGDADVFYLDESGIRSLRARDASNAASTSDVGNAIDTLITTKLATLTADDRLKIIGLIEPRDGRFWLIVRDTIYVFSFFSGAKVSAWSTYEPGFTIDDACVYQNRVYVRSGDAIYAYGGLAAAPVYDDTVAEAWLPYLDGGKPTTLKHLEAIDAAIRGSWAVSVGMDPTDLDAADEVGQLDATTFLTGRIPANGNAPSFSARFRSVGTGPASLAAVVIQFDGNTPDAKD